VKQSVCVAIMLHYITTQSTQTQHYITTQSTQTPHMKLKK